MWTSARSAAVLLAVGTLLVSAGCGPVAALALVGAAGAAAASGGSSGGSTGGAGAPEAGPTPPVPPPAPVPPPPTVGLTIAVVQGQGQAGLVGTTLPAPLVVVVSDLRGGTAPGVAVHFEVTSGDGIVGLADATTDGAGHAQTYVSLGATPGAVAVAATVNGTSAVRVVFTAEGIAPDAVVLAIVGGDGQNGTVGTPLGAPLVVRALAPSGAPVAGARVHFSVVAGDASLTSADATTSADGQAGTNVVLGTRAGSVDVGATPSGSVRAPLVFRERAVPGSAARLSIVSGDGQARTVGVPMAPLVVGVADSYGNAVEGVSVAFASSQGTVLPATSASDASGRAQTTFTPAGTSAASIVASAGALRVTFNEPAAVGPTWIGAVSGLGQYANAGNPLPSPLQVRVVGPSGAGLAGLAVTFAVTSGTATLTTYVATTARFGLATTSVTAASPGVYTVSASAFDVAGAPVAGSPVSFQLRAAGPPANVETPFGGSLKIDVPPPVQPFGTAFFRVVDAFGTPVAGETVTFSSTSPIVSVVSAFAVTNTAGGVQTELREGTTPGAADVVASVAGATSGTIHVRAVGPPVRLAVVSGDGQVAPAGAVLAPLVVQALDAAGWPVAGAYLSFGLVAGEGTLSRASAITDASGVASTGLVLSPVAGTVLVKAATEWDRRGRRLVGVDVTFTETGLVGPPVRLAKGGGDRQVGVAGAPLLRPIVAVATDDLGNKVPGVAVTFAVSGGGSVSSSTVVTDGAGRASTTWTPGPGPNRLAASASGPAGPLAHSPLTFEAASTPEVASVTVGPVVSGCVSVAYSVRQLEGKRTTVLVEVDPGTGSFFPARQASGPPGSDGTIAIVATSDPAGTPHVFLWNSTADLPHRTLGNVVVRVTPSLGGTNGVPVVSAPFLLANGLVFEPRVDRPVGTQPSALVLADVDAEGRLDLVTANEGSDEVVVVLGRGRGTLRFPTRPMPRSVAVGAVTSPGATDLVVANGDGTISTFPSSGRGSWGTRIDQPAAAGPCALAIADLDRDGRSEVVVANAGGGTISIFRGSASGLGARADFAATPGVTGLALGDLDRDGRLDVVVAGPAGVFVLRGDGTGGVGPPVLLDGGAAAALATADVDRDGRLDVVAATAAGCTVLLGDGAGAVRVRSPWGSGASTSLAVADVDGDGQLDVVLGQATGTVVLLQDPGGGAAFGRRTDLAEAGAVAAVGAGDLDLDGRVDVVVATRGTDGVSWHANAQVRFVELDLPAPQSRVRVPERILVADLDGDGKPDVLALSPYNGASVCLGTGNGELRDPGGTTVPVGAMLRSTSLVDVDEDGVLDLVTTASPVLLTAPPPAVLVLRGDGTGRFGAPTSYPVPQNDLVRVADLDGDGHVDIVAATWYGSWALLGDGMGSFGPARPCGLLGGLADLMLGDLNGDGFGDAVCAIDSGLDPRATTILLGRGDGTFGPAPVRSFPAEMPVAIVDLDGDGRLDLVTWANGSVQTRPGRGDGTFSAGRAGNYVGHDPVFGDLNGDGQLDVVAVSSPDSTCSLSTGPFQYAAARSLGLDTTSVAIADVDGDGRLDVVQASRWDVVSVFRGDGRGGFVGFVPAAGERPTALVAADANRDGKADAVTVGDLGYVRSLVVHAGSGDGSFAAPAGMPGPLASSLLVAADLDGDGITDFVTASGYVPNAPTPSIVSVFLGSPSGAFARTDVVLGADARALAIGDVDGDGMPDIVLGDWRGDVSFLRGLGGGGFAAVAVLLTARRPVSGIALGDLDRDGRLDLSVAVEPFGEVHVYLGSSAGFVSAGTPGRGSVWVNSPCYVSLADLNGDGVLDLVTANGFALGDGTGRFGPLQAPNAGAPVAAVGDVDGDGVPDLVAAGQGVRILRGRDDGTFAAPVAFYGTYDASWWASPQAIVLADVDGDGRVDLLTAEGRPVVARLRR